MYISGFNPSSFAMGQSGHMGTSAINPSMSWTAQPMGLGMATSAFPNMGYMMPVSQVFGAPGFTSGSFGIPSSQAISYSFLPSSTAMSQPMASPGFHLMHTGTGLIQPRIELAETNSDIVVTAELPNVNPNDLNLTVTDDSVSISCTAFASGIPSSVHRTIALPTSVRSEEVTANYSNGILECRLPKSDLMTRRRIRVNPIG